MMIKGVMPMLKMMLKIMMMLLKVMMKIVLMIHGYAQVCEGERPSRRTKDCGGKTRAVTGTDVRSEKECIRIDLESKRADRGEEGQMTNNTPGLSRKYAPTTPLRAREHKRRKTIMTTGRRCFFMFRSSFAE